MLLAGIVALGAEAGAADLALDHEAFVLELRELRDRREIARARAVQPLREVFQRCEVGAVQRAATAPVRLDCFRDIAQPVEFRPCMHGLVEIALAIPPDELGPGLRAARRVARGLLRARLARAQPVLDLRGTGGVTKAARASPLRHCSRTRQGHSPHGRPGLPRAPVARRCARGCTPRDPCRSRGSRARGLALRRDC